MIAQNDNAKGSAVRGAINRGRRCWLVCCGAVIVAPNYWPNIRALV